MPGIVTLLIALLAVAGALAAPAASAATSGAAAAKPAETATATAKPPAKAQPAKELPAAPSVSERRKLAAAAVQQVLTQSTVPDTCSGAISPDTIYPCSTPSSSGTDTFTITLADTTDLVYVLPVSVSGNELGFTLTAPDASTVNCQETGSGQYVCPTSQAGAYTLAVGNGGNSYTLDYTALMSDTGCTAINPSFAAPAIAGSLAAGQTGSCYTLDVPSGSVLYLMGLFPSAYLTELDVYDSTGANQNCNLLGTNTCTVGGTGPYRIFIYSNGTPDTYQLQLNNLTNPQGCVATPQLAYGQVPDTSSTDPCRTLTVTTAGSYQVVPVPAPTYAQVLGTVYAADGSVACQYYQYPFCPLAVGTYNFVTAAGQTAVPFGFDFIAGNQSSGCTTTGDTGFQDGPATGKFAGIGEELCLTLPTPNGKADYFLEQQNPDGTSEPSVEVIDATGALQCGSNADFNYDTCTLSGTAPFRVLLSAVSAPDSYRILIQRTDYTAGCRAWPQSGFGGSYGATVTLTASDDVKCLTIPAGQHSTGEMIDYSNAANVVDGAVYVNDPAGNQVCVGTSLSLCSYQPHVTYTALVITTASNGDTYHLVRRDVSATAKCARPASTTVGGASTTFSLTSDLDTTCTRVTAAATDMLWFSVRTVAPAPAGAVLLVTNASGAIVCRQFGTACQVTGSTDYQLVVDTEGYSGAAITTHLDTWLVGTAAGWAPQCLQNQFSAASGWGPLSGTLTERATGYCAVVNVEPQQSFGIFGTDTAVYPNSVAVNLYTAASWASPYGYGGLGGLCYQNNYGQFGFGCSAQSATQAVLLVTPGTSPTPVGYTMQGVCQVTCASPPQTATITAVTPSSQPAGPDNSIVVTGTGLNLGTQVQLASNGSTASYNQIAFPQSVNAAGTQLTLLLNTTGITPGTYDVVLNNVGYTAGTPSPGYLPGAYTVTAAS